jgi:hypothetical protein
VRREILISPRLPVRNHAGLRGDCKLIESTCDSEKEWRFWSPDILRRLPAAVFSLFFE